MIDDLLVLYDRNLDYARRLVADLPEEKMAAEPALPGAGAMNHAAWVLGHLARTCDGVGSQFGLAPATPAEWGELFGGGSKPVGERSKYPAKAALVQALENGHRRVAEALRKAGPAVLNQPPADEKRRARWPTVGMMLVHMLISHESLHLGQLSAWRRAQGLPSV